jgi:hypothetical protein
MDKSENSPDALVVTRLVTDVPKGRRDLGPMAVTRGPILDNPLQIEAMLEYLSQRRVWMDDR